MKKMTCKELGGACDMQFQAESFEEIAEQSKKHGIEMFKAGDSPHLLAMDKMKVLMQNPEKLKDWFANKRKEFESLPDE